MGGLDPLGVFVQPDLRRKRVQITLPAPPPGPIRVSVEGLGGRVEGARSPLLLELPEFQDWSPDSPNLLTARCEGVGAGDFPPISVRFGMRECTIKENRFQLNNKQLMLRGVVLDASRTDEIGDTESARVLVGSLKRAGFNFLRVRGGRISLLLIDAADELGLLVCDTLEPELDAAGIESQIMERRNHPSIVMWHAAERTDVEATLGLVHEIDPSRIVVSALDSLHGGSRCLRPYQNDVVGLDSVTCLLPAPTSSRGERYYEHVGEPDAVSVLGSFGTQPGLKECDVPDMNAAIDRGLVEHELTGMFENAAALESAIAQARTESLSLQVQAARVNTKLAGYCVDGMPARDAIALSRVQTPLMLAIRASRTNLVPREEVPVTVAVVNDERIEPVADLSLQVVGPTNQVLWKKKRSIKVPKHTREVWAGTISASGSVGIHKFVVRLMQGTKLLAQNSVDLHVVEAASPCDVEVSVVDPHGEWTRRCVAPAKPAGAKPRVYIVPPLANTVRAYPDDELIHLLNEVRAGAVAIVFGPPPDWNDLAVRIDESLKATSAETFGGFHYVRVHPVFDGLPSRCLMRHAYRNVVPRRSFEEQTDERVCGSISASHAASAPWWGEDILVRRFGSGRVVFTHARVLEHLGDDPVADRLYVNLLRHFGRRSVPGEITQPIQQSVVDWLRRERSERARLWSVIGPFPNWGGSGHETRYPPEQQVDLTAVHAGWRDPVRWTRWYTIGEVRSEIDFDAALGLPFAGPATAVPETFYTYAECSAAVRQDAVLRAQSEGRIRVFVNGVDAGELPAANESKPPADKYSVPVTLKQGKNALLIKLSRAAGPAIAEIEIASATRDPLLIKWWR